METKTLMKKILVVGGTGFIGYHLSQRALNKGWDVTSLSQRSKNEKAYYRS